MYHRNNQIAINEKNCITGYSNEILILIVCIDGNFKSLYILQVADQHPVVNYELNTYLLVQCTNQM